MKRREFCVGLLFTGPATRLARAAGEPGVVDQVWTDARRNREVPVRIHVPANPRRAPVVLFSHGLGGSRSGGTRWGRHWAANGFISVHMQHHGSDELLWKDRGVLAGLNNLRRAMTVENGVLRVQDAGFVLDEIVRRGRAGDPQWAAADLDRIGMSGHSFGARTTIALASQMADRRIRAAIAFSPVGEATAAQNRERAGRIAIPFLSLTGTEDRVPLLNDAGPAERQVPYQFMPAPDKYLLVLNGADHMVFNGEPEGRRWSDANHAIHAPLIERATLAFWKAYLGEDAAARAELAGGGMLHMVAENGEWFAK